jgi:hypothetical protein
MVLMKHFLLLAPGPGPLRRMHFHEAYYSGGWYSVAVLVLSVKINDIINYETVYSVKILCIDKKMKNSQIIDDVIFLSTRN